MKAENEKLLKDYREKEDILANTVQECAEQECVYILHEQQVKSEKE